MSDKSLQVESTAPVKRAATKLKVKGVSKRNGKHAAANGKRKRAPRTVDLSKLDRFGFRLGSIKSKAAGMYASKKGATLAEVKDACDSAQFNLLTELEGKGFKIERTPISGPNDRKVTRYHIVAR